MAASSTPFGPVQRIAAGVPPLAAAGYRVLVPYLRGHGATRFLSDDAPRNGQQPVLAVDAIALMGALGVGEAIVGGFDWGARTANVMAALWRERGRAGYRALSP
jgi:pimeloyl-ACP methyl ester carboxylesterase